MGIGRAARAGRVAVGMGVAALVATACQPGIITTVAGTGVSGYSGDHAAATQAAIGVQRVAVAPDGSWYFSDTSDHVRRVGTDGIVTTAVNAGGLDVGFAPYGDGGPASQAVLQDPEGVAVDAAGDLFVADTGHDLVRRVDAATGIISTVAGGGTSTGDGVPATDAALTAPTDIALDPAGDLFIVEPTVGLVLRVDASTQALTTLAGGGTNTADGIPALQAVLAQPGQVAASPTRPELYVATAGAVRAIDLTSGQITTVAGDGTPGFSGDGFTATAAQVGTPVGLAVDPHENLYLTDGNRVRKVDHAAGTIATLAGTSTSGFAGDGKVANAAALSQPLGLAMGANGALLVADSGNNRVRSIADAEHAPTIPTTKATVLASPYSYFGGDATQSGTTSLTTTTQPDTSTPPDTVPCKVTGITSPKTWWSLNLSGTAARFTGLNYPEGSSVWPSCQWTIAVPVPLPIPADQSPGFWVNIAGPASDVTNGDAYGAGCYNSRYCAEAGTGASATHASSSGYWFSVTAPGTAGNVAVQVFDAGHYPGTGGGTGSCASAPISTTITRSGAGDSIDCDASKGFTTNYTIYQQSDPHDPTTRTALTASDCGGQGSSWSLATDASPEVFENSWATLCTLSNIQPGDTFLVNVRTTGDGDGTNRFALRASAGSGTAVVSPVGAVSILSNIHAATFTMPLAEVPASDAGKTLDVDLWDPGDVSNGATIQVLGPDGTVAPSCTFDASAGQTPIPAPGVGYNGGAGRISDPTAPAASGVSSTACSITSAASGVSNFNGLWLHIRVPLPVTYTCDATAAAGQPSSCWWSISYVVSAAANDVMTLQATAG